MKAHVFGNTKSQAKVTYGLQKALVLGDNDVGEFVSKNFYVDNGLTSLSSKQETIQLLTENQKVLKENENIRLYKIVSNSVDVMKKFPADELGSHFKQLNLCAGNFISNFTCSSKFRHVMGLK